MTENTERIYCRKCTKMLPKGDFYDSVDLGFIDTNGKLSVCKSCIQELYDNLFTETQSIEKTIHKLCVSLNIKFSNEAVSATKSHIETMLANGITVNAVFGIYKQKLVSTQKSMDKSIQEDNTYADIGTIYVSPETINTKEIPIPQEVQAFWGKDVTREDIEFLEGQYANFKGTHKADTYAEITLLKQVCFTLLDIKNARAAGDSTEKLVKELREVMGSLAIAPDAAKKAGTGKETESFGLWIQDLERYEPAEWLSSDPRGDMYRDVGNVEEYFQKYIVRPLKNFILGSKDFNIDEEDSEDADYALTDKELEEVDIFKNEEE